MIRYYTLTILSLVFFFSCKNEPTTQNQTAAPTAPATQQSAPTASSAPLSNLPMIPREEYEALANNTNAIDLIPFGTNISMNITDKASCYQFVSEHILDTQVAEMPCDKPNGRIFFNKDGNSILEANIFYTEQCQYLVFYKPDTNTPIYATQISDQGKKYFDTIYGAEAMEELKKLQRGNQ